MKNIEGTQDKNLHFPFRTKDLIWNVGNWSYKYPMLPIIAGECVFELHALDVGAALCAGAQPRLRFW